ncbi:DUF4214 domain-containing protein [Massilia sp. G4R7]|uniref:DUF4214 domain-containing protein n=1 Tax=Massilia phyllostachyos TaxID=2898585 RepID=A0ABS8QAH0_9BURK|nr:DUF4214 domain-containing protein [Massilia phyllostachyos]MCD2517951.1 DUF4214 domain-containing protein [Massilia phyllostachyos]
MATVSDITTTPLSGLNHIDALLDKGPDWNFLTSGTANTLYYTFSVTTGNEQGRTGQEAFTLAQQSAARYAFTYLQQVTGIKFVETTSGTAAQIHLANIDIAGASTTGLCSWYSSYSHIGDTLSSYSADAYVYLDNAEWFGYNRDLTPGGVGYQTLLHELGHALGLGHPFHEADEENHIHLPWAEDNTANTIMSYTDSGGPYSTFSPYDLAALNWLYGGDGLGGALGIGGAGRYITGTSGANTLVGGDGNDLFVGMGGNDIIQGGLGTDTVLFSGARSAYTFSINGAGDLVAAHAGGTITMTSIEQLSFTDGRFSRNDVVNDTVAPAAPQLAVSKNANGYAQINQDLKPIVSGVAEANSLVKIYAGDRIVGEVRADASGVWQVALDKFADGKNYAVRATATDGAGNVSDFSEAVSFHIDATAPVIPTARLTYNETTSKASLTGTGEAGTTLHVVNIAAPAEIGRTTVKADGSWSIDLPALPNGAYTVRVSSADLAGNATSSSGSMQFTVNNPLNVKGTAGADMFTAVAGNAAIEGGAGLDTISYAGARADFTIERGVFGVSVTDKTGTLGADNLFDVERIKFNDTMVALDIDGIAGQIYRLYQAAFDRKPDEGGMSFYLKNADTKGVTLAQIAESFTNSPEYRDLYLKEPSNTNFVTLLYNHVLHREPEQGGFTHWMNILNENRMTRVDVLAFFAESAENRAQVIGDINNGIEYVAY